MKKILLLLSVFASVEAIASPVSPSKAQEVADSFFGTRSLKMKAYNPTKASASESTLYVFNRDGGGFVIVAGDDAVDPILAYSDKGSFDPANASSSAAWWLGFIDEQIGRIRAEGQQGDERVSKRWRSASARTQGTPVVEFSTAAWDQGTPYNNVCSSKVHSGVATGCVATAAAILCRYWQWPTAGEGTCPAYTTESKGYSVSSNTLGHTYDYSQMPLTNGSTASWTSTQKSQVATLMYDLGQMSYMDYDSESGAITSDLVNSMMLHMKYSKQAYEDFRSAHSDDEWIAILKAELDLKRPVLYGGSDNEGGHQFLFDGYDSQDYFRVNWGWGGEENGYFRLSSLGQTYKFNYDQSAVIGLVPDKTGSTSFRDNLMLIPYPRANYNGLTTTATTFVTGKAFTVKLGDLYNNGAQNFDGTVCVAVYDKSGNWKEDVSTPENITGWENNDGYYYKNGKESYKYWSSVSCTIKGAIKGGDRLRVHYKGKYSEGFAMAYTDDCKFEIVLADADTYSAAEIAEATSLSYDKTSGKLTLKSDYSVTYKVNNSSGRSVLSGTLAESVAKALDFSAFEAGTYSIVLNGGSDDLTIKFTL